MVNRYVPGLQLDDDVPVLIHFAIHDLNLTFLILHSKNINDTLPIRVAGFVKRFIAVFNVFTGKFVV